MLVAGDLLITSDYELDASHLVDAHCRSVFRETAPIVLCAMYCNAADVYDLFGAGLQFPSWNSPKSLGEIGCRQ
jgi:hypothetical protein